MTMKKADWPKSNSDVCIRCATCMAVCPVSRVTPLFPGPKQAGPGAQRFRKPDDPSVDEWIDLCIGCHLCDLACPSGVPIAELNLLAKAKSLSEKKRPLRDWLLTHPSLLAGPASLFPVIANFFLKNRVLRWLADHVLRIDRRRELPLYQSPTFRQWFREHRSEGKKKIAYFYGCYINTNEVDVGMATVQVLESNGFEVQLPPQECCGLPMLGSGNFKEAKKMAYKNVSSLLKTIRSGFEIVFSSTSCGHMIRHDYGRLLNIPGSEEVAKHLFDLFEFLKNLKEKGDLNTRLKRLPLKVAYFAPCHLRALGIGFPALEVLRLIPGLEVQNIEADCCGLGGTFGFKKEKYEISQEIGKDLKKAVDLLKPEIILTDCEGCRMQIRHLTGLKVLHPIQILRESLMGPMG